MSLINDEHMRKPPQRTVEVVRVGSGSLDVAYPQKQIVRLRDLSRLYADEPLQGLAETKKALEQYSRGQLVEVGTSDGLWSDRVPDDTQVAPAIEGVTKSVEDLYDRLCGKRLSAIKVDLWDQISGAYLGATTTDANGTLILPTDAQFVEVLQWKLASGGYSDCFNGERAAGTPGLFFYFPCNEGGRETVIKSFPGVSGQQATLPSGWTWHASGFFNRPALKCSGTNDLELVGAPPVGYRGFQFLWYCYNTSSRVIWEYSAQILGSSDFALDVYNNGSKAVLRGILAGGTPVAGTTELKADTWYLIQINTKMYGGYRMIADEEFQLDMDVYLGSTSELSVTRNVVVSDVNNLPLVTTSGILNDGFDELRCFDRELYSEEITAYSSFLKRGRVSEKSQGNIGNVGW